MTPLIDINYVNLFIGIKKDFPILNEHEYRICCRMCAEFTTDEIADILRTTIEETEKAKKSITRKLYNCGYDRYHLKNYIKKSYNDPFSDFGIGFNN